MNTIIQKLHLNLKKRELFIRNNNHEVKYHLFFLSSMLFFSPIKDPRSTEKLTVSESNINPFLICVNIIQIKLNKLCNGIQ